MHNVTVITEEYHEEEIIEEEYVDEPVEPMDSVKDQAIVVAKPQTIVPSPDVENQQQYEEPLMEEKGEKTSDMMSYSCLCFLFLLLIIAAILLILTFVTNTIFQFDDEPDFIGMEPTTPLDPYQTGNCNFQGQTQPHVLSQCECTQMISTLADNTIGKYERLRDGWIVDNVYSSWSLDMQSCEPANQALVWLATGYAEDNTDLLQRYILAYLYFSTEGTEWINQESWLSDVNVCDWFGVECADAKTIGFVNLNNNGLRGPVSANRDCKTLSLI